MKNKDTPATVIHFFFITKVALRFVSMKSANFRPLDTLYNRTFKKLIGFQGTKEKDKPRHLGITKLYACIHGSHLGSAPALLSPTYKTSLVRDFSPSNN